MAKLTGWGYDIVWKMFPPRNGCTISLRRRSGTGWGVQNLDEQQLIFWGSAHSSDGLARAAGRPSGRRGTGSNKNACLAQGCPWLMCSHRKMKWTKCDYGWPRSRKSDMLDKIPSACRKSCGAGERRNLGASRICVKYSHPIVWLQGECGCGCKLLPEPEKEVTDPGPHPQQLLSFFLFSFSYPLSHPEARKTEFRCLDVWSLCLTVVVTMVAACSLRYHVWSCKLLFHALLYRSYTVGCLKRHFFFF